MADEYLDPNYFLALNTLSMLPAGGGDFTKNDALWFAGISLAVGVGGYLFYREMKRRQQENILEVPEIIRQSMNKHPEVAKMIGDQLDPNQQYTNDIRKIYMGVQNYSK